MPIRVPSKEESANRPRLRNAKKLSRTLKRKRDDENLDTLEQAVKDFDLKDVSDFSELPITIQTTAGLDKSHFKTLTDIQRKAIPLALKGKDVLGAAKTGSGKTLAFLIPVLEILYRKKWTQHDGLGALIISPTRELAIQIFDVLRKVGQRHAFSAGLVIGGKSLQEEKERLGRMNILVCTPGRMLQHLDQNPDLDINNVQVLVLDEADRILDMGFKKTIDAILDSIPNDRQTLLFSATQTKNVSDLARLSLKDPEYVSVHEAASTATPSSLQQHYIITPLPEKLDTLWSFIRSNVKAKILVFLSSQKQVRFVYETFRHMQPGIPLMHLHGKQKQTIRADIVDKFSRSKNSCLIATDVVARGIDFPAVDWVVQVDCPEDADTYIHRVGRTARYESDGRAVMFLCPTEEEGMLKRLAAKKVPIEKINVKQNKKQSIKSQLQNFCFQDPELKYLGQKAFVSYARSIYIQKDKEIFDLEKLPVQEYAESLGLPGAPKIKFMKGEDAKNLKNAPRGLKDMDSSDSGSDNDAEKESKKKGQVRTKYDRMFERQNQNILTDHYKGLVTHKDYDNDEKEDDDAEEFLRPVRHTDPDEANREEEEESGGTYDGVRKINVPGKGPIIVDSKKREKMVTSKKAMLKYKGKGTKLIYDEEGNPHAIYELEDEKTFKDAGPAEQQRADYLLAETRRVLEADVRDREVAKEKRKAKREKKKMQMREDMEAGDDEGEGFDVQLIPYIEDKEKETEDKESAQPAKKQKKWFQDDSDEEKKKKKKEKARKNVIEADEAPETLEDLEMMASGLLG